MCKSSNKLQRNARFPSRILRRSARVLGVLGREAGQARADQRGRGFQRRRERPDALASSHRHRLVRKSLEEGEKSISQLVLLSPKVRWPQNESAGEV